MNKPAPTFISKRATFNLQLAIVPGPSRKFVKFVSFRFSSASLPLRPLRSSAANLVTNYPLLVTCLHAQITRSHVQSHLTFLKGQPESRERWEVQEFRIILNIDNFRGNDKLFSTGYYRAR